MQKCITHNIEVSVRPIYHEEASAPELGNYVYMYEITIINKGEHTVQLKSREWIIGDVLGEKKQIKGLGVVGEQPILKPNDRYTYVSGCNFSSTLGTMKGNYSFLKMEDGSAFRVRIPKFVLPFPPTLS